MTLSGIAGVPVVVLTLRSISSSSLCSSASLSVCWWCMKRLRTASSSCSSRRWISRFIACNLEKTSDNKHLRFDIFFLIIPFYAACGIEKSCSVLVVHITETCISCISSSRVDHSARVQDLTFSFFYQPASLITQFLFFLTDHSSSLILSVNHEFLLSIKRFFFLFALICYLFHLLGQLPVKKGC